MGTLFNLHDMAREIGEASQRMREHSTLACREIEKKNAAGAADELQSIVRIGRQVAIMIGIVHNKLDLYERGELDAIAQGDLEAATQVYQGEKV